MMGIHDKPLTPCVGRCSHNVGDYVCKGCGRTVEEVRDWNTYPDDLKRAIIERLRRRNESQSQ